MLKVDVLQAICDANLRILGLGSVLNATDEHLSRVRASGDDFNNAVNLVNVAIRELEGVKAAFDTLEALIRNNNE